MLLKCAQIIHLRDCKVHQHQFSLNSRISGINIVQHYWSIFGLFCSLLFFFYYKFLLRHFKPARVMLHALKCCPLVWLKQSPQHDGRKSWQHKTSTFWTVRGKVVDFKGWISIWFLLLIITKEINYHFFFTGVLY